MEWYEWTMVVSITRGRELGQTPGISIQQQLLSFFTLWIICKAWVVPIITLIPRAGQTLES